MPSIMYFYNVTGVFPDITYIVVSEMYVELVNETSV